MGRSRHCRPGTVGWVGMEETRRQQSREGQDLLVLLSTLASHAWFAFASQLEGWHCYFSAPYSMQT